MARHPDFSKHVDRALADLPMPLDGLSSVGEVLDVFRTARLNFLAGVALNDPSTSHEKLHWAMLLLRSRQAGDFAGAARAIRHYPTLGKLDLAYNDIPLTELIATLARKNIADQLRDLAQDPTIAEHKKIAKKDALRRKAAAWAPQRRTSKTFAILDSRGLPAVSPEAGAGLLRDHWMPSFTGSNTREEHLQICLPFIQEAPTDIEWTHRMDAGVRRFSATPGGDGGWCSRS
jgi:hypothetical protein